jgi:hypothetical protein
MAMEKGEHYRCTDESCRCEIEVTRGPQGSGGHENPRCCCGSEMKKVG